MCDSSAFGPRQDHIGTRIGILAYDLFDFRVTFTIRLNTASHQPGCGYQPSEDEALLPRRAC